MSKEFRNALGFGLPGVISNGFAVERGRVDIESDSGMHHVSDNEPEEEGECGDHFKIKKRFAADPAHFLHILHAGDACDQGTEDDQGDGSTPRGHDPSDMFKRFFGNNEPRSFRTEGSGTGFIVDKKGYLITNYHVVENADRIKVRMAGESTEYRGHFVVFVVSISKDGAIARGSPKPGTHTLLPLVRCTTAVLLSANCA